MGSVVNSKKISTFETQDQVEVHPGNIVYFGAFQSSSPKIIRSKIIDINIYKEQALLDTGDTDYWWIQKEYIFSSFEKAKIITASYIQKEIDELENDISLIQEEVDACESRRFDILEQKKPITFKFSEPTKRK